MNSLKYFQEEECPICLEDSTQSVITSRLPCGHVFHLNCINELMRFPNSKCPMCRQCIVRMHTGSKHCMEVQCGVYSCRHCTEDLNPDNIISKMNCCGVELHLNCINDNEWLNGKDSRVDGCNVCLAKRRPPPEIITIETDDSDDDLIVLSHEWGVVPDSSDDEEEDVIEIITID